jgi:hypothetical protein
LKGSCQIEDAFQESLYYWNNPKQEDPEQDEEVVWPSYPKQHGQQPPTKEMSESTPFKEKHLIESLTVKAYDPTR